MNSSSTITLVAVTQQGVEKARILCRRLRSGELLRPARYGPPEHGWESTYDGALSDRIPEVFARSGQIVFFLAVGAAVRLIAPCVGSKETDPGVLAVDESGRFVIPLLGGHQGGANAFARTVAGCLGAMPVITTASDVIGGLSPDLLEDAFGWRAEPRELLKPAARALVDGEPIAIVQEIGASDSCLAEKQLPANVGVVRDLAGLRGHQPAYVLWITDRIVDEVSREGIGADRILWYRPKSLVLGVGCERGISAEALEDGLSRFLEENRYSRESIGTIASVELKADERGAHRLGGEASVADGLLHGGGVSGDRRSESIGGRGPLRRHARSGRTGGVAGVRRESIASREASHQFRGEPSADDLRPGAAC